MKLTLLLLWSLGSVPLHDACSTCAPDGAGWSGQPIPAAPYHGVGTGPVSQFNEFSSPCGDCYGGDGYGRCNRRGRGNRPCCDSTCDMHQHYPYVPDNLGYYYFAPYNYTMVWKHQQWITTIGGDPRNPYSRSMFIPVYEQFENTVYEPDLKPSQTLSTLPNLSKPLPELDALLRRPEGAGPIPLPPVEADPVTPAPEAPAPEVPVPGLEAPAAPAPGTDVPAPEADGTELKTPGEPAAVPDFDN